VIVRDSVETFDGRSNVPKRSLAEDLRMRREMKERMSIERMNTQITNTMSEIESPSDIRHAAKNVPFKIDRSGSAFKIRP
jgi:hypothetical protein